MSAVEKFEGFDIPVLQEGQAFMAYMTVDDGDVRKIWDKSRADEVEDARRTFNNLVEGKGYRAYQVKDEKGTAGGRMNEFDPNAERMILIPRMAGG